MKRSNIIHEIYKERDSQDEKWGGKEHDQTLGLIDWASIIEGKAGRVVTGEEDPKNLFIEIASVCFAALEVDESWK